MREDFEKVVSLVNYFELNPDVNQYEGRFILQKMTFFAQSLGIDLNYNFTIYVAGPYSNKLTKDYYNYKEQLSSRETSYELTDPEIIRLQKIREYCDFEGDMSMLESTATFVYLIKETPSSEPDEITVTFRALKPHISNKDRIIGLNQAKQLLFKEEYLTDELKREMDRWDLVQ